MEQADKVEAVEKGVAWKELEEMPKDYEEEDETSSSASSDEEAKEDEESSASISEPKDTTSC